MNYRETDPAILREIAQFQISKDQRVIERFLSHNTRSTIHLMQAAESVANHAKLIASLEVPRELARITLEEEYSEVFKKFNNAPALRDRKIGVKLTPKEVAERGIDPQVINILSAGKINLTYSIDPPTYNFTVGGYFRVSQLGSPFDVSVFASESQGVGLHTSSSLFHIERGSEQSKDIQTAKNLISDFKGPRLGIRSSLYDVGKTYHAVSSFIKFADLAIDTHLAQK